MPPAARVGDMHVCPMVTALVPHVGGPILPPGCPTVLIGMMPAARVTDMLVCVGPPDVIAKGSPTVLIGNMMAARMGDLTAHGGTIVIGFPTVIIGEAGAGGAGGGGGGGAGAGGGGGTPGAAPAIPQGSTLIGFMNGMPIVRLANGDIQVGNNITITGSPAFQSKALADLGKIAATKTGKSILEALDKGTHKVTIKELDMATAQKNGALAGPNDPAGSKDPTKGSDTTVSYNPDVKLQMTDQDGKKVDYPVESMLGHELIHAVHNSNGTNERDKPDPKEPGSNQEESHTIGINDHKDEPMSENNLLKDMGAGFQRTDHDLTAKTK